MEVFLYFKSGKQYKFIPQIRLTRSKNRTTGTAVFELNIYKGDVIHSTLDPIYGVGLQKNNLLRMADICQFIWALGKPIKIIAIFIFTNLEEKQDFFNSYPNYADDNSLEFFPAHCEEKTLNCR